MQSIMHVKYLTLWLECLQLRSPSEPASLLHMLQKKQELRFALLAAQLDYLTYRPTYMMLTMRHNLQQDLHIWWWFIPSKYSLQLPNCSKLYKVDCQNIQHGNMRGTWYATTFYRITISGRFLHLSPLPPWCRRNNPWQHWMHHICMSIVREAAVATFSRRLNFLAI